MPTATFLKSLVDLTELPEGNKAHVALVGRSNVGKSSLVNHLVNQKMLARVSASPGRTKTINIYTVDRRFYLIDLPGYGYAKTYPAKRAGFSEMIQNYLANTPQLKLVLLIIDASLGPTELDLEMLGYLQSLDIRIAMIANKIDKLSKAEQAELLRTLASPYPDIALIPHSTTSDTYRGRIWDTIERAVRNA